MTLARNHLEISLRPSVWHCALLAVVHLLALIALVWARLPILLALGVGIAVVASLGYSYRRFGLLRHPRSVIRVAWHDGNWQLVLGDGNLVPVNLDGTMLVLGWLVVTNFRDSSGNRYAVVLLPGSAPAEAFRRLRVLLKFGKLQ